MKLHGRGKICTEQILGAGVNQMQSVFNYSRMPSFCEPWDTVFIWMRNLPSSSLWVDNFANCLLTLQERCGIPLSVQKALMGTCLSRLLLSNGRVTFKHECIILNVWFLSWVLIAFVIVPVFNSICDCSYIYICRRRLFPLTLPEYNLII